MKKNVGAVERDDRAVKMNPDRTAVVFSSRVPTVCACLAVALSALVSGKAATQVRVDELVWAYAPSPFIRAPDDGTVRSLAGSERTFTRDEIRNTFGPADWFPDDHPNMPQIVAVGRESAGVWACSMCHYPNGKGRPENAGVAGLSKDYIIQQMRDFKNGLRVGDPATIMIGFAQAMTDEEIEQAAEYFSSMAWTPWIEVVETDTVPKTYIEGRMHLRFEGPEAGFEAIGRRIIETPINTEETEVLRNPRSGFIAYVPVGSVAAGEALAATGGGKTIQCSVCHGESLNGLAMVPAIRGRSPSYIARQLTDFQHGTRRGASAPLMQAVVEKLTADDILNLSAYLTSLPPQPERRE